jgi:hypothetical protein
MHAAFPRFFPEIHQAMRLGLAHGARADSSLAAAGYPKDAQDRLRQVARLNELVKADKPSEIEIVLEGALGSLVADGMAVVLELAFGLLVLGEEIKGEQFFEENFVFRDPNAPGGKRYYQGKFLITTRDPNEDMNVLLQFCPRPDALYFDGILDPAAVVTARAVGKEEAATLKNTPFAFDLLMQFRDLAAIFGLIGSADLDMVGLMLQNKVQFKGNTGHLFKLGAISAGVQAALEAMA